MKATFTHFFALSLLLILTSCSKKPVEVTGQIFVITQGRENIKMGGVEVLVVPDEEFRKKAKEVVTWMQQEAKAEAQRKVDSDHMTDFINEVIELEKTSSLKIPELPKIRESIVKESSVASGLIESAMKGDLQTRALINIFAGNGEKMGFTTDADGKFTLPLKGKAWFHAMAERKVGDNSEGYIWLKGFEAPDSVSKASLVISNDDDIKDEDELYSMLAGACVVQGQLENFRKVDVSENMKSLVERHREEVESAKAKAEKDAAEAKVKAERDVAEAKAKADEAYKKFSGSRAGEERVMEIAPGVKMTFCWCPPSEFMMGSPPYEADRGSDEDQVKVTLSKGFWIGKTEVTQAQWEAVMGSNPSHFKGTNLPVESVSWNDAQKFLQKIDPVLAATDGWKTILPTEAQWEYAARAGDSWRYSGGNNIDEVAWYNGNSSSRTNPVGIKKSNAWGLHDMSGNVREWCHDWYDKRIGGGDPAGAISGSRRVLRGGSWVYIASHCRVADRVKDVPSLTSNRIGFRVVRSLFGDVKQIEFSEGRPVGNYVPKALQLKSIDWAKSQTDYASVTDDFSFDVGMGNAPRWGYGFASAEMEGIKNIIVEVQTKGNFKHYDANSFAGFIIDYSTQQGYSHRVMLGIGMLDNNRWHHDYYADLKPVNVQYLDLGSQKCYKLELGKWAPNGWDGKIWFTTAIQNTGAGTFIKAQLNQDAEYGVAYNKEKLRRVATTQTDFEDTTVEDSIDFPRLRSYDLDTLELIDGRRYRKVTLSKVEPDGIRILHEDGATKILFDKLPPEFQKKFGYDPME